MNLPEEELATWLRSIKLFPTEVMIASLIFTLLPRLETAELYAEHCPTVTRPYAFYPLFDSGSQIPPSPNHIKDVVCLSRGINRTKIQKLSLSGHYEAICLPCMPKLISLTLNCTRKFPLVPIKPGRLSSLHTLKINQSLEHLKDGAIGASNFGHDASVFLASLPSLLTLEFSCGTAAEHRTIPNGVEHNIIGPAVFDAVIWGSAFLKSRKEGSKLKQTDIYWPDDSPVHAFWLRYEKGVEGTGAVVIIWHRDEVWKKFERVE